MSLFSNYIYLAEASLYTIPRRFEEIQCWCASVTVVFIGKLKVGDQVVLYIYPVNGFSVGLAKRDARDRSSLRRLVVSNERVRENGHTYAQSDATLSPYNPHAITLYESSHTP